VKDLSSAAGDMESDLTSLQAQVQDLNKALVAAAATVQAECKSVAARWPSRFHARVSELLRVQDALHSRLECMSAGVTETSAELELSVAKLGEEKHAHIADAEHRHSQITAQLQKRRATFAKVAFQHSVMQGKENEIKTLHDQVSHLLFPFMSCFLDRDSSAWKLFFF